jgi:hypothetical protein
VECAGVDGALDRLRKADEKIQSGVAAAALQKGAPSEAKSNGFCDGERRSSRRQARNIYRNTEAYLV